MLVDPCCHCFASRRPSGKRYVTNWFALHRSCFTRKPPYPLFAYYISLCALFPTVGALNRPVSQCHGRRYVSSHAPLSRGAVGPANASSCKVAVAPAAMAFRGPREEPMERGCRCATCSKPGDTAVNCCWPASLVRCPMTSCTRARTYIDELLRRVGCIYIY